MLNKLFFKEIILEGNSILFKCSLNKTIFPMHQNSRYNSTSEIKQIYIEHLMYAWDSGIPPEKYYNFSQYTA